MNFNFSEKLNNFLKIIAKNAQDQKVRVFFVGGLVRDNILNLPIKDIDLILEGSAIDFSKTLPELIKIKSTHKTFNTVKLTYENLEIDLASTRIEKYPHSGCLPVVTKTGVDIKQDYKRRDFTINSLYCEIKLENNNLKYELIDLTNGIRDIKNKTLKVLHKDSYVDDPTRILRGLDFKYRFNFDFSSEDKLLIKNYLANFDNKNMSIDRFKNVLKEMLAKPYAQNIFKDVIDNKLYKIVFENEIKPKNINFENLSAQERGELYYYILENKEINKETFKKKTDIISYFKNKTKSQIAYYFYRTDDNSAILYEKIKNIKLNIKGSDLIQNGYKQGFLLGEILDNLLEEKINNPSQFISKEDELLWVKNNYPLN